MTQNEDARIASLVLAKVAAARTELDEIMERLGLLSEHGWRVGEKVRHTLTGHEFVFWPVHSRERVDGIEVVVRIDQDGVPED